MRFKVNGNFNSNNGDFHFDFEQFPESEEYIVHVEEMVERVAHALHEASEDRATPAFSLNPDGSSTPTMRHPIANVDGLPSNLTKGDLGPTRVASANVPNKQWRKSGGLTISLETMSNMLAFYAGEEALVAFEYHEEWRYVLPEKVTIHPKTAGARPYLTGRDIGRNHGREADGVRNFTLASISNLYVLED